MRAVNHSGRKSLREIIGIASHLDGLLSERWYRLPADQAYLMVSDLARIEKELGYLAEDVECLVLPKKKPLAAPVRGDHAREPQPLPTDAVQQTSGQAAV
jgi:hypothetical protein